jgi:hypothetical protein
MDRPSYRQLQAAVLSLDHQLLRCEGYRTRWQGCCVSRSQRDGRNPEADYSRSTIYRLLVRLWPFGRYSEGVGWRSGWGSAGGSLPGDAALLHLPARFAAVILPFAALFAQDRTWRHAQMLLLGALLTPGQRTVCAILRMVGLRWERHFVSYHRVLNRAVWRSRIGTRLLFDMLLAAFAPRGPVLLGIDDTIERRRGKRISAKRIDRDPVRSSKAFFVKTSGLRWLSLMLLVPIAWAGRVWALPFLTVLAPSERYCRDRGLRHKALTDWARQIALQARRWLPGRELGLLGDSSFAALERLAALVRHDLIGVTRLRLDAALDAPAPPRTPGTTGRPRKTGARRPTLAQVLADPATVWHPVSITGWSGTPERRLEICSQTAVWFHSGRPPVPLRWVLVRDPKGQFDPPALLCTDPGREAVQIIRWFVQRWPVEVTPEPVEGS